MIQDRAADTRDPRLENESPSEKTSQIFILVLNSVKSVSGFSGFWRAFVSKLFDVYLYFFHDEIGRGRRKSKIRKN